MATLDELKKLIENFDNHIDEVKSKDYNEMTLCTNFLNPLFRLLGWDVENAEGKAEKYKDVIQQYRLTIGGSNRAPDYLFRIGGSPAFFVEAKKPAVDIEKAKDPAFQLRRYGWNKKEIDVSILSDFEHLCVYDCKIKPSQDDEPNVARIAKYHYKNFIANWEEIESMFSRSAVEKGSLDRLIKDKSIRGQRETVDESFLKMIEEWRDVLARNIALRNEALGVRDLNYAVQQTIDRIIFLRIAEDRGLETPNQLQALTNYGNIYGGLAKIFENADSRYNSGLFHFKSEKGNDTPPDTISLGLSIDDKVLKEMITSLYNRPYDFSAMPADILGQVYERFLGKVIRLTDGHHAKVEEKPEVRKAGGVYYTPTYIVDYIVQNTVGKLVEGKTPEQVAKLKILDPACGSGSFLIGAYQFLLDWHLEWYLTNDRDKWLKGKNPPICEQMRENQRIFKLTTEKRKEILKNNIYGVDIDRQAVEVSKLNLLLKVLEEENNPALFRHNQRALPDLGSNVKCGNSLIGSDFYNGKENLYNNPEETWRINAFDWDREFPQIIRYKKSSSVLPPRGEGGCKPDEGVSLLPSPSGRGEGEGVSNGSKQPQPSPLLKGEGVTRELEDGFGFDAVIGNPPWGADLQHNNYIINNFETTTKDSAAFFLEIAARLSKRSIGFIIPKVIGFYSGWESIRTFLLSRNKLIKVLDVGLAFPNVILESIVLIFDNKNEGDVVINTALPLKNCVIPKQIANEGFFNKDIINIARIIPFISLIKPEEELLRKLYISSVKMNDVYNNIFRGLYIPDAEKELLEEGDVKFINKVPDVKRYVIDKFMNINITHNKQWLNKSLRIMVPRVFVKVLRGNRLVSYPDEKGIYLTTEKLVNVIIDQDKYNVSYKFLSGIINSKLPSWYIQRILFSNTTETSRVMDAVYFKHLPLPKIDFTNKSDVAMHDKMVSLVETMLGLNKRLRETSNPADIEMTKRQIEATDNQIDQLVYRLYGLTDDEIRIVEDSFSDNKKK